LITVSQLYERNNKILIAVRFVTEHVGAIYDTDDAVPDMDDTIFFFDVGK